MKTYKLPPRFYADHVARDLPEVGITSVVSASQRATFVEMDAAAYDDLLSDSRYYASEMGGEYQMAGLARSAAATVKVLERDGRPGE